MSGFESSYSNGLNFLKIIRAINIQAKICVYLDILGIFQLIASTHMQV
jgi:hypothetical protein